ncbi:unnamed protein product [Rotaria magnacalcarata]|uniref:Succinate dehydrogenase [ubiquinone] cytochrome b small subunit n=3 Tax=Rotaria magnacalcarata TaxID=392030 RepID=A0A816UAX8_9BILA|nr:unnamed protein product [Rotaria magnacalcarata]CAF1204605.1 unnamed protein product [Rotaria magnacalcarata]CAF2109653.1 unnamed protein product [Rotaria magnacalcarata]CAF3940916.1 unnamed protein product [Rotaria magnacalcarata]
MTLTETRGFRRISHTINPAYVSSSFLGGPSSKTMVPMAGGATIQPIFPENHPQPSTGLAALANSDHWKIERIVALAMLAVIPGSFVCDSVFMNYLLAASLAIHAHWGMDAVLIDYCPRNALPLANIIRYALTLMAFVGLCYFNYNDMGVTKALKALWSMY